LEIEIIDTLVLLTVRYNKIKIIDHTVIFPKGVRQDVVNQTIRHHQRPREWDSSLPTPSDSRIVPGQAVE